MCEEHDRSSLVQPLDQLSDEISSKSIGLFSFIYISSGMSIPFPMFKISLMMIDTYICLTVSYIGEVDQFRTSIQLGSSNQISSSLPMHALHQALALAQKLIHYQKCVIVYLFRFLLTHTISIPTLRHIILSNTEKKNIFVSLFQHKSSTSHLRPFQCI